MRLSRKDSRPYSHFGKSVNIRILHFHSAYAIMPIGKKDMTMFHVNKERTPGCISGTFGGSSLLISVVEHPLGYSLSLSCLSNHLQMRWQVTPAATVTKKDMTNSMRSPPPVAGFRLDNMVSITQNIRSENDRIENMCVLLCAFWGFHFSGQYKNIPHPGNTQNNKPLLS